MAKKWAERMVEQGLCVMCGKVPPIGNTRRCLACTIRNRAYSKKYRERMKEQHRCEKCYAKMPDDWFYVVCPECKAKVDRYYQIKRDKRKAAGLCPKCGKAMDREGGMCQACLKRQGEYFRMWRA